MPARLSRRALGRAAAASALSFASPPARAAATGDAFPFGTHIYREPHLPLELLRADLPLLKRLGFTMVKVQESWALDEQREGDVNLDNVVAVVAAAREHGLRVFFGVTMEQAPGWFWRKHPDAHMVYESGEIHADTSPYLLPGDGKPGPCWHHPGARADATRFLRELVRRMARFDNVAVWNVWQEVGFYSWAMRAGRGTLCHCRHSYAAFRSYLRATYRSLARLNDVWRTGYGAWEEIEPPRMFAALPPNLDFRRFMEEASFADALRWKGAAFRDGDPARRPVMAHTGAPRYGSTQDFACARAVDVWGSSVYPDWGGPFWETPLLRMDYTRAAAGDRPVWAAELQGGPISDGIEVRRAPSPSDVRRWALGCLAAGAQGLCFWNHRPEIAWSEANGFGLLDGRGRPSDRAQEAGRLARAIEPHAALFARGRPPTPAVAIGLSSATWHFVDLSPSSPRRELVDSVRGWSRALAGAGHEVGFVDLDDAAPITAKVLVVPFPIALASRVIDRLAAFVAAGGALIAEACPGRFDDHGFARPGELPPELERLFGARHGSLAMLAAPAAWDALTPDKRRDRERARRLSLAAAALGNGIAPTFYLQRLEPTEARPLAHLEADVVATIRDDGAGRAILLGTLVGPAIARDDDGGADNGAFAAALVASCGARPDRVGRLARRRRTLGVDEAWFLVNATTEPVREALSLEGFTLIGDLLGDPLPPVRGGATTVEVAPESIRCLVLRRG